MTRLKTGLWTLGVASVMATATPSWLGQSVAAAGGCYSIWAEAQEEGSRYRHLVYVRNDCEYWLECSLWTDVNPQPPKLVSVGPRMTERAETSNDSTLSNPKGFGSCHRK